MGNGHFGLNNVHQNIDSDYYIGKYSLLDTFRCRFFIENENIFTSACFHRNANFHDFLHFNQFVNYLNFFNILKIHEYRENHETLWKLISRYESSWKKIRKKIRKVITGLWYTKWWNNQRCLPLLQHMKHFESSPW